MKHIFHILMICSGFFFLACQENGSVAEPLSGDETFTETAIQPEVQMKQIAGGDYLPFYGTDSVLIHVDDFLLDERPVTNREFLDFVQKNPQWKKSNVRRLFADETYLAHWETDDMPGEKVNPDAPVTFVSWFAANAYAKSAGKRLPTVDEWEYVAMADETSANARSKPEYSSEIIRLYEIKYRERNSVKQSAPNYHGIYNMFDLVWEWTGDFNSVLTTNDSRTAEYDNKGLFCASAATTATDVLNYAAFMRFAFRQSLKANYTVANLGFRCAKDLD